MAVHGFPKDQLELMRYKRFEKPFYITWPRTSNVYRRAHWTRDEALLHRRLQRFRQKKAYKENENAKSFALSRAWIVEIEDGDAKWEVRPDSYAERGITLTQPCSL
jgi:DNA-binding XRE family transcriptional regulator